MGKNCNEKKLKGKVLIKKIEEKNSCIQNKKIQKMREMEKSFNEKKLKRKEGIIGILFMKIKEIGRKGR